MFIMFSYKNFFSMIGKAFMLVCFLSIVLQTPKLNAQSLVEKARKEGKVTLYTALIIPDTQAIGNAFAKKYPFIKFEFHRSTQSGILQKTLMEKQRSKTVADVIHSSGALLSIYRKEGLVQKYVPLESKSWPKGFKDPEGFWTTYYSTYMSFLYNTRMVDKKDAPNSYEDLLDPKWKGKIGMFNDEFEWYQGMLDLMGREKGLRFMKSLVNQDVRLYGGRTLTTQLMVSGEFPLALGNINRALQMKKRGAPLQWVDFPTPTLAALRCIMLHADAPNPNAGKLFIEFLLSKEGQSVLNRLDRHPVRMDIKVDPVIEKVRQNLFPIVPTSADKASTNMKEYYKIFSIR